MLSQEPFQAHLSSTHPNVGVAPDRTGADAEDRMSPA